MHMLLLCYIHVIALLASFPLIFGMLGQQWLVVLLSIAAFVALAWWPAIWLHARNAVVLPHDRPWKYSS